MTVISQVLRTRVLPDCYYFGEGFNQEKVANSLAVYASNFASFCQGRPFLLYTHELLMKAGDLFFSLIADMQTTI